MRICPQCRTEYTDDALQYCLQDGTPLVNSTNSSSNFNTESETVVSPKQVEPIRFEPPSSYQNSQANWQARQPVVVEREAKKSNTAAVVALSVLGTILVLGLGGAGAWLYLNGSKKNVAVVSNNSVVAAPNRPANLNAAANNQNANANVNNANLASPSPSAKPTINPEQAKIITSSVKDVISDWKSASENLDITSHLSHYADTVDYYTAGKVNIARVRADKEKAFSDYDSINLDIDNLRVIPDPSGDTATAIFDKGWKFEGAEDKSSTGKVQQQLTLSKINGRWLITGEKDLKVYYKE